MFDDDPWGRNIFEDMDFDEVVHPTTSCANPANDHIKQCNTDSVKSSRSKTANETEQSDLQNEEQQEKLCEEDIDNFLDNEKAVADEENDDSVLESLKSEIGMTFNTREEAQNFYNTYSFVAGFSVAIVSAHRTTSKKRHNEIIRVTMKCNKYGQNTEV